MSLDEGQCILCRHRLGADVKPEHILLNALGGRKTTRKALCSACNHMMGIGPDHDLAESAALHRNICQFKAGDGDRPPQIRGITTDDGYTVDLLPGLGMRLRKKDQFQVSIDQDSIRVNLQAFSEEQADRFVNAAANKIASAMGHQLPEVVAAIEADLIKERRYFISPPPRLRRTIVFGGGASQQAMLKACLVLLAERAGAAEVLQSRYDEARSFVLEGPDDTTQRSIMTLDTRPLPTLEAAFGLHPNLVWVGTNEDGEAYGYFRLYGAIGWRFRLCGAGAPPNNSACLISNPYENKNWAYSVDSECPLSFSWVREASESTEQEIDAVPEKLQQMANTAQEEASEKVMRSWCEEAAQAAGLTDGDLITEQHIEKITKYLTPRLLSQVLRIRVPLDE